MVHCTIYVRKKKERILYSRLRSIVMNTSVSLHPADPATIS